MATGMRKIKNVIKRLKFLMFTKVYFMVDFLSSYHEPLLTLETTVMINYRDLPKAPADAPKADLI